MNIVKLDDVANFVNGGAWNQSEYTEKGIPVVRVSDIHHATVDLSQCKYLPHSAIEKYAKNRLEAGDLVICTVGSHATQPNSVVGRPGIIPAHCRGTLLNQNAVCIRPKNNQINKLWLGYLARSQKMKDHIIAHARGSASQVRVAISALKDFEFEIPSLIEQETVSKILNNYDNLIENNNRRIAILEDMAQSLYREWFVNFRYPGHADNLGADGKPKLFDSPLGKIPQDWGIDEFGEQINIKNGFAFKSKDYVNKPGTIIIRTKDFSSTKYISVKESIYLPDELLTKYKGYFLQQNDFLLIMVGASIGKYGLVFKKDLPALQNQNMWAFRPKVESSLSRAFIMLSMQEHINRIMGFATGSAREFFRKEFFLKQHIVIPSSEVIELFGAQINPMIAQLGTLLTKNENLIKQRDMLLPKLISGQIELKD